LAEENSLKVFGTRVLRRIFGTKRDELTGIGEGRGGKRGGEGRELHNEELNYMYCLPNNVRVIKSIRIRWTGHVERMGGRRGEYRFSVGKPEGKRQLGTTRRRWKDNIEIDL
jgi:hypothetical protein